ncbi:hemerythrin domain-containing protein [Actinokineospora bangkokensis]|uniref:Hemerythrin-like domain-containing protein n=1 Tax=Actinokineospora bangkokensis TaxID=1193682 RepID=A0A1Q9LMJ4_9PSEU|nr:hemerythrin domain-containing protein [Actinokineospora bangkokensis]OLR93214.1 hypothetical protein BJP25_17120 [Actinokineospora bangkokensis]
MTLGELAAVPTPDPGVRLSRERLWDEGTRPRAPHDPGGRGYTPRQQAAGRRLIEVHDLIRAELAQLRGLLADLESGVLGAAAARDRLHTLVLRRAGTPTGGYCQAFCRLVVLHHHREDTDVFPGLRRFDPRLGAVVDRLEAEHTALHGLVDRIDRVLVEQPLDPARLRAAVDLLTDALLSHLSYEEHELVEPLARLWG